MSRPAPTRSRRVAVLAALAATALAPAAPVGAARIGHAIPSCLRGTWREVGEVETISYEGRPLTLRGDAGRTLTFSAAGREVASYAHATALRGVVGGRPYVVRLRGSIVYTVAVHKNTLDFLSTRPESLRVTETFAGHDVHLVAPTSTPPVTFTCSARRLVQAGGGYRGTFVRVG
ncbi:MAG TPA: hypothetical protein PLS29_04110 [Acidimicrobiales bacterium]|nr:MAG: hypothetical protein B7Z69_05485 [Actinobacteria bacterium 21-73-9]HQU26199.1 hypothetical protein [Acidimicrobiales bacterium]